MLELLSLLNVISAMDAGQMYEVPLLYHEYFLKNVKFYKLLNQDADNTET